MQLRGSAANILVPDATADFQQSAGDRAPMGHDVVLSTEGGRTQC